MHTLAVTEQGTRVHVQSESLLIERDKAVLRRVRLAEIDQVLLFGGVELSSRAIAALARRDVDVVFLTQHGTFRARLITHASRNVQLRLAQVRRSDDANFCLAVTRAVVDGKLRHQRLLLLRRQRQLRDPQLAQALGQLRLLIRQLAAQTDLDALRGFEGRAAALYFQNFGKTIQSPHFTFHRRTRRPPRDPVNACLSFGYTLLTNVTESEVARCGLDPMIGFFHQPAYGRPSLVLDLVEEFRPFIDTLVLRLINRRQLSPRDFRKLESEPIDAILADRIDDDQATPNHTPTGETPDDPTSDTTNPASKPADAEAPGIYLTDPGRRVFLNAFFGRLRERIYYPPRNASLELRQIIREQAYHLARVIENRDPQYKPFVPR